MIMDTDIDSDFMVRISKKILNGVINESDGLLSQILVLSSKLDQIDPSKCDDAREGDDSVHKSDDSVHKKGDDSVHKSDGGQKDDASSGELKRNLRELITEKTIQMSAVIDDLEGINNYAKEVRSMSRGVRTITTVESSFGSMSGEEILSFCGIKYSLRSDGDDDSSLVSITECDDSSLVPVTGCDDSSLVPVTGCDDSSLVSVTGCDEMAKFLRFKDGDESDDTEQGQDAMDVEEPPNSHRSDPRLDTTKFQPPYPEIPPQSQSRKFQPQYPEIPPQSRRKQERTNTLTSYPQFEQFRNKEKRQEEERTMFRKRQEEEERTKFRKRQEEEERTKFRNPKLRKFARHECSDSEDSNPSYPSFQTATQVAASQVFQNKNGRSSGTGNGYNGRTFDNSNGRGNSFSLGGSGSNSHPNVHGNGASSTTSKFIPPIQKPRGPVNSNPINSNPMQSNPVKSNPVDSDYGWVFEDERVKTMEKTLIERILSEIVQKKDTVTFEGIAGLESVKSRIRELVILPMVRPELFQGIRSPGKGVLLFGPPGTGKSMIGKCVASQSKATFFSISASVLTSKWVGDGEKMVRALFSVARILQPTVIFIDEIDSLLTQRNEQDHECSRRMKTEFLLQFDGLSGTEEDRLLVIGATNRPEGLDEAARRRFTSRLYIPLPGKEARIQIVTTILRRNENVTHNLTHQDLEIIADKTDGFSGADMSTLAKEAAMLPLRSAMAVNSILHISPEDLRPIDVNDFLKSLQTVKSSVSPSEIEHYEKFNQTFGA